MFKEYRLKKNLTQDQLAELVNIDIRSYQDIEAGRTIPLASTYAKIVLVLELNSKDIQKTLEYYSKINKKKGKKEII